MCLAPTACMEHRLPAQSLPSSHVQAAHFHYNPSASLWCVCARYQRCLQLSVPYVRRLRAAGVLRVNDLCRVDLPSWRLEPAYAKQVGGTATRLRSLDATGLDGRQPLSVVWLAGAGRWRIWQPSSWPNTCTRRPQGGPGSKRPGEPVGRRSLFPSDFVEFCTMQTGWYTSLTRYVLPCCHRYMSGAFDPRFQRSATDPYGRPPRLEAIRYVVHHTMGSMASMQHGLEETRGRAMSGLCG